MEEKEKDEKMEKLLKEVIGEMADNAKKERWKIMVETAIEIWGNLDNFVVDNIYLFGKKVIELEKRIEKLENKFN